MMEMFRFVSQCFVNYHFSMSSSRKHFSQDIQEFSLSLSMKKEAQFKNLKLFFIYISEINNCF